MIANTSNMECIVFTKKKHGQIPRGKHEAHDAHIWWYTSYGGGHQMNEISDPDNDYDGIEGKVKRWYCPGD